MDNIYTAAYAKQCDELDELKAFRDRFYIPMQNGKEQIYFTGNSLGLQPKQARAYVMRELQDWAELGVEGHFEAMNPWYSYHTLLREPTAKLVGAQANEVVVMNSLTVNLHLLMVSFYRPTAERYKIIIEADAFPSDKYAVQSQARHHGFEPSDAVIAIGPRTGEHCLRTEDIVAQIEAAGNQLALVLLGGVNYYTGQFFEAEPIVAAAHKVGAYCGLDLAHAAGNVPLRLHDWGVDFAAWCSYKYLNSGPGGTSGVFIHEKHATNTNLVRFAGWWGNDETTRFEMADTFVPKASAEAWQLSNAQIFPMALHRASLAVFEEAGMDSLRKKSLQLTAYLEDLLHFISNKYVKATKLPAPFTIITPADKTQRGCQLSILTAGSEAKGKAIFTYLSENGVVADWRTPNVIRIAPVPLYNTFTDVFNFAQLMDEAIQQSAD